MFIFRKIYIFFYGHFSKAFRKRVYLFSNLLNKFWINKNNYLLNLIGYKDTIFKKFIKLIFLYFFFKPIKDLIFFIILIIFEIYLFWLEIIFNILFDFRIILNYFKKYMRIFIYIDDYYYRFLRSIYLFMSLNKLNIFNFKNFENLSLINIIIRILILIVKLISYIFWFFFTRKQTRKKYLIIKKLILNIFYFIFLVIVSILIILNQFLHLDIVYIYKKIKALNFRYYKWPKANTKKILFLKLFYRGIVNIIKKILKILYKIFMFFFIEIFNFFNNKYQIINNFYRKFINKK